MKKVFILSLSDLHSDPRVFRQIRHLSEKHAVTAAGFSPPGITGVEFVPLRHEQRKLGTKIGVVYRLLTGSFEKLCRQENIERRRSSTFSFSDIKPDIIIANDIETLPLALEVAGDAPVIFDAHEYAPREYEDKWLWRLMWGRFKQYLCARYIPEADRMITVCQGIADEYERNFGVRPEVMTNATRFWELKPSPVDNEKIRMIHHGGAQPSRKIESMIRMMDFLDDRFMLDLMLVNSDSRYCRKLRRMASANRNIRFIAPVPMQEIVPAIAKYDIGVYPLPPVSFNNRYALPNKFFEFIQARLAVAIGPSPEMAKLVREYDCGIVADSFDPRELAGVLNGLTREKIEYYKARSHVAAGELSEEKNLLKLDRIVEEMLLYPT